MMADPTPDLPRPSRRRQLLLEVRGLKTHFFTRDGVVKAVDGVDFSRGEGRDPRPGR